VQLCCTPQPKFDPQPPGVLQEKGLSYSQSSSWISIDVKSELSVESMGVEQNANSFSFLIEHFPPPPSSLKTSCTRIGHLIASSLIRGGYSFGNKKTMLGWQ
jgi:hypothetical protein